MLRGEEHIAALVEEQTVREEGPKPVGQEGLLQEGEKRQEVGAPGGSLQGEDRLILVASTYLLEADNHILRRHGPKEVQHPMKEQLLGGPKGQVGPRVGVVVLLAVGRHREDYTETAGGPDRRGHGRDHLFPYPVDLYLCPT